MMKTLEILAEAGNSELSKVQARYSIEISSIFRRSHFVDTHSTEYSTDRSYSFMKLSPVCTIISTRHHMAIYDDNVCSPAEIH